MPSASCACTGPWARGVRSFDPAGGERPWGRGCPRYTLRGQEWHIGKHLKLVSEQRIHRALVFRGQVVQAAVDPGPELLEGLVVGGVQRLLAEEAPQPLDQVEVGRVARQVQQL